MHSFILMLVFLFCNFSLAFGENQTKVYQVKSVQYLDDDGYNDELYVVLGNSEVVLLIRWFTGINFLVGDKVTVLYNPENTSIEINNKIYSSMGDNLYILW